MRIESVLAAGAIAIIVTGGPGASLRCPITVRAQEVPPVQQAAPFAGPPTWFSAAFTIGNLAYVATGYDATNALWQYDGVAGSWTRKADFPGSARGAAVAFSVGGKGYVGTGFHADTRFADLWEYNPAADAWSGKAPIPGRPRDHAVAFVLDDKAYVAGGMTCEGHDCPDLLEVWQYDPRADRWARRADLPEPATAAACFVLNGKAYVVGGRTGETLTNTVLEYDPRTDRWMRKAAFPGPTRSRGVGFSAGGKGYVATGLQSISYTSASVLGDLWEYEAERDHWTQKPNPPAPPRGAAVAFVIGSRVFIGTGVDSSRGLLRDFWWFDPTHPVPAAAGNRAGTLPPRVAARVDAVVKARMTECRSLVIGVVGNGKILFTRAYGEGRVGGEYEYASVSKPVTSTIVMQLRRDGLIKSLDDNIWAYIPRYADAMPPAYRGGRLTLKQLLTHRSGIPHNDQPPLVANRFNLQFEPGTRMLYSTPGYGLLGQVIEAVTGLSYSDAVRKYIAEPVGATSFRADPSFIAPGAYVSSNIEDMARFALGVMDNRYIPTDVLYGEVLRPEAGTYGYGWGVANLDRDNLTASHSGSNGLPRAHLLLEPRRKAAVVILAQMRAFAPLDLAELATTVLAEVGRR